MLNVTKELTALARKLGYSGKAPDTVAKAIDAITSVAGEGSGDCDPGYEVVETELFNETITTSLEEQAVPFAILSYNSLITEPSIIVTFDDSTYTVPLFNRGPMGNIYGEADGNGPVFSTYPFLIMSDEDENVIYTETESTHTITVTTSTIQTSDDFSLAVNSVMGGIFNITATAWDDNVNGYILDKTVAQIKEAYANGQLCLINGGINTRAKVLFSTLVIIESTIDVDIANNQLILTHYDLDAQTGVVSGTEYLYTLTPASND